MTSQYETGNEMRRRSNRGKRGARPSRIPAVVALLLVIAVVLAVGLSVSLAGEGDPSGSTSSASAAGISAAEEESSARDSGSVEDLTAAGEPSVSEGTGGPTATAAAEDTETVTNAGDTGEENGVTGLAPGGYSEMELEALANPLPVDAIEVRVPVLMYHYVDDEPPPAGPYADGLTVRTPDFVEELEYLAKNGYQTVRLADVYLAMAGVKELPEKPVALTFDDGGLDNYTVAFPLLEEYGFTGTFFVITKTVGRDGQMDWDQLREMAAAGMSIQSHTVSHPDLTGVSDERLRSELVDSRSAITQAVGELGYAFCYPAGSYNERVLQAVKAAGYVMAVVTDKGEVLNSQAIFEIRRSRVQAFLPISTFAGLLD